MIEIRKNLARLFKEFKINYTEESNDILAKKNVKWNDVGDHRIDQGADTFPFTLGEKQDGTNYLS